MRTARSYYEILGLPRGASVAHIRRRYKELVRKFHPDVAEDKQTAHRLFLQIQEAYETLNDPLQRKAYDTKLDAQSGRTTGFAQARVTSAAEHLREAQWSFIQRRYGEAAEHCREALRTEPRSAKAYAILGDASRAQGRINSAIKAYSFAVQYDPTDHESQRKLDRLLSKKVRMPKATPVRPPASAPRITLFAVWWSVAIFLIMLINVYPGHPMPWIESYVPHICFWSLNMVVLMAAASCVVGMLLSIGGLLRSPDDELVYQSTGGNWAIVPTGLILIVGSVIFFIGAAAFYIAVGLLQGSLSKSVLTVFAGVAGVVLLTSVVYLPGASHQVLCYGGNVSFFAMLVGWYIGYMFRPVVDG